MFVRLSVQVEAWLGWTKGFHVGGVKEAEGSPSERVRLCARKEGLKQAVAHLYSVKIPLRVGNYANWEMVKGLRQDPRNGDKVESNVKSFMDTQGPGLRSRWDVEEEGGEI
jgi:hypothetical protein